jgi:hypothetical protein
MNAPTQRDLFTKRWRKVRAPAPLEADIQKALVLRLVLQARRDALWYHPPNGGWRHKVTAALLQAMGVLPGVADLVITWPELVSVVSQPHPMTFTRVLYLELKRRGKKPSADQNAFAARAMRTGASYEVADSIDAAVTILQRYGVLPHASS